MWEQHNDSDLELKSDILPIVAEDASYKLWEIINNLKTFTRHSGGKLTTEIVNEVLKDCDIPPAVGAHDPANEWKPLECEGSFFYQADDVLDLRDEYLNEVSEEQNGPIRLDANWVSNQRNIKDLTKLWQSIMLAIVLGDDAAFQYTIHTTLINPFVGCVLPHLVQKSIEYLSFGYSDDTLDRLLRFLKVLVQNYHSRDVANNEEYFNLSSIFVCLLLGTADMKTKLAIIHVEQENLKKLEKEREEQDQLLEKSNESLVKSIKQEFPGAREAQAAAEVDYMNDDYTNYVLNPLALSIKTETPDDQRFFDCDSNNVFGTDYQDETFDTAKNAEVQTGTVTENLRDKTTATMNGETNSEYYEEEFSPFVTTACDEKFVDEVCKLIGYLSGKWGFFEHETTYLLAKRLEIFFFDDRTQWTTPEWEWLARVIQALSALGETAFRELTCYFQHIPYEELPEWLIPRLSYGGIYIRGRKDYYFYEFMQEVCGDSLLPFLVYYKKYMDKLTIRAIAESKRIEQKRKLKRKQKQQQQQQLAAEAPLKISTKSMIRFTERTQPTTHTTSDTTQKQQQKSRIDDLFPERTVMLHKTAPTQRRIGFKFAGCCPVLAKQTVKFSAEQQFVQSFDLCNKLNKHIIVCRRKLLKPIHINYHHPNLHNFIDYRQYNI